MFLVSVGFVLNCDCYLLFSLVSNLVIMFLLNLCISCLLFYIYSVCNLTFPLLQDLESCQSEGQPKIDAVATASEQVLPTTSPRGCDVIKRDVEQLEAEWQHLLTDIDEVSELIKANMVRNKVSMCVMWVQETCHVDAACY